MKIRELAKYCESIDIDCDVCENKKECDDFQYRLEDISPFGVVGMIDNNIDIKNNKSDNIDGSKINKDSQDNRIDSSVLKIPDYLKPLAQFYLKSY